MDEALPILLAATAALAIVAIWLLARVARDLRVLRGAAAPLDESAMHRQIEALREQVRTSLDDSRRGMDQRLLEVHRSLGTVDRQARAVEDAARDLRGLQELLRSPKLRGGLGEYLLAELLAQVLPPAHFSLQYEFDGGERVDAVIHAGDRLVPVDAKFPLENFRRMREAGDDDEAARRQARRSFRGDVRRHVDAIAERYIRPGAGTLDFALMYLPAEAIYRELLDQERGDGRDLLHYALTRRVVPVSPQSFYAYLQVILLGLRGLTIETHAREIMDNLGEVRTRLERFGESFDVGTRHVANAQRQLDEAARRLERLQQAVERLAVGPEKKTERPG